MVDVIGENGREEVIEARDILRLPGTGGGTSPYIPAAEGDRLLGVPLSVPSSSTFVELFQGIFAGPRLLLLSSLDAERGEVSSAALL